MNDTTSTAVIDQPAAGLSRDLLDECHRLAMLVAPELNDAPLYVMNRPESFPRKTDCAAVAIAGVDFQLRESLIAAGLWRGPGRMIVFVASDLSHDEALGLTLHEAAHCVEFSPPEGDREPTPAAIDFQRMQTDRWLAGPVGLDATLPGWFADHGPAFIRTCLHLHFRSWRLGYEIGLPQIRFAGEQYDLSPPWRYLHALGDEPARKIGEKIETILALPPPNEFIELFRRDATEFSPTNRQKKEIKE